MSKSKALNTLETDDDIINCVKLSEIDLFYYLFRYFLVLGTVFCTSEELDLGPQQKTNT